MAFNLYDLFYGLGTFGFFQYIVPFMISFMVMFAILEKTGVFGQGKTDLNMVLSFLLSLTVVANENLLSFMNSYISNFSVAMIFLAVSFIIFMFITNTGNNVLKFFASIFAILAVLWSLMEAKYASNFGRGVDIIGPLSGFYNYYVRPNTVWFFAISSIVLFIGFLIYMRSRSSGGGNP
jgi:hypothetical protein